MSIKTTINSFFARKILKLFNAFANKDAKNITRTRRRMASEDTARFVDEHLYNSPTYGDRLELLRASLRAVKLEGLYLEFGVYKGVTINLIASQLPEKMIFGFDSFEGLPEDWRHDFKSGAFALDKMPVVSENVKLIKGWFDKTLPEFIRENSNPCAFIHVDCDLYSSTKTVFDILGPQIVAGTVVVFDEYFNYPGWRQGEFKALHEMIENRGLKIEYLGYCDTDEQVAIRLYGQ